MLLLVIHVIIIHHLDDLLIQSVSVSKLLKINEEFVFNSLYHNELLII